MIYKKACRLLLLGGLMSLTSFCFGQLPAGQFILRLNSKNKAINTADAQSQGNATTLVTTPLKPTALLPSIITFPEFTDNPDANGDYRPGATSTNTETPITYKSDNPAVGYIINGYLHLVEPGVIKVTASQAGNANYAEAVPVTHEFTFYEFLRVTLPDFPVKKICDNDFSAGAVTNDRLNPLTYSSSNLNVATVDDNGNIHIVGQGSTQITVRQDATLPYFYSAEPAAKFVVVTPLIIPRASISAFSNSQCAASPVSYTASVQNGGDNPGYQWQVNNVNAGSNSSVLTDYVFKNGDIVTCTVINQDNACISAYPAKSAEAKVTLPEVLTPSVTVASSATSAFAGTLLRFTATAKNIPGNINYQWYVNGTATGPDNPVFSSNDFVDGDMINCIVTSAAQCDVPVNSNSITVKIVDKITIPNAFTPNGDGVNDLWNIAGLGSYPNSTLYIYNKYGKVVFQSRGYSSPWNGTINSKNVPAATYYYVIDLGDKSQKLSGDLTILR